MANARGEVVTTPTQEIPFKAVIYTEGKIIEERFFASRPEAEAFIVDTARLKPVCNPLPNRLIFFVRKRTRFARIANEFNEPV